MTTNDAVAQLTNTYREIKADQTAAHYRENRLSTKLIIGIFVMMTALLLIQLRETEVTNKERQLDKVLMKANFFHDNAINNDYMRCVKCLEKLINKPAFDWDRPLNHPAFNDRVSLNEIADSNLIPFCKEVRNFRDRKLITLK